MSRSNFFDLFKDFGFMDGKLQRIFGDVFKTQHEKYQDYVRDITFIELLFYSFQVIFDKSQFSYKSTISMMIGHDDIVFRDLNYDLAMLKRVRSLMKDTYSRKQIMQIVETVYSEIPSEWRLYDIKDSELIVLKVPKYEPDRVLTYQQVINDKEAIRHLENKRKFISDKYENKEVYVPLKTEGFKVKKKVSQLFEKEWLEKEHTFPLTELINKRKMNKKDASDLNNFLPNRQLYEEMGISYLDRYHALKAYKIQNRKLADKPTDFYFTGEINHVIATTGAGKGTLTHGLIYRQCKQGKKKIMYFTENTKQTMKEKERFEQWGLKVGVIVGKSNLANYQTGFIKNKAPLVNHPFEVFQKHSDSVETLSPDCLLRKVLKLDEDTSNPCQNLCIEGRKKRVVCPAYEICGYHHRFKALMEADIWIGTPESFLRTKAPYAWDKYERNFLELGVLWSDLIIIDEVDQIQMRLDQAFLGDLNISTDKPDDRVINEVFSEYLFNLIPRVVKSSTNDVFVHNYIEKATNLRQLFNYMYGQIFTNQQIVNYIYNKLFTPYSLLKSWHNKHISKDEKSFECLLRKMQAKSKVDKMDTSILWTTAKRLQNICGSIISEKKLSDEKSVIIDDCFRSLGLLSNLQSEEKETKYLYQDFELILFLFLSEQLLRHLRSRYENFMKRAKFSVDKRMSINNFYFKKDDSSLFTPDALTDSFMAYRLKKADDKKKHYSLVAHEYRGVGRKLLSDLPRLFEGVEDFAYPALLILSATSDFLDSSYYGVKVPPNWLLENTNQEDQKIKITLCPIADISGAQDQKKAIQGATLKLINSGFFDEQIKSLKQMHQEEKQLLKRKLLLSETEEEQARMAEEFERISAEVSPCLGLVVNSYQKAEWIADTFKQHGFKFKFKVLYSEKPYYDGKTIQRQDYHVSTLEVEQLHKEEPEVFVFVRPALARGYNILAGENTSRSLLRTIVYYERPHPIPGDFKDVIMTIHSNLDQYKNELAKANKYFYEAQKDLHRKAFKDLHELFSSDESFANMDSDQQKIASTNELVTTIQLSGRGQRGGTSLHLFFLDNKMIPATVAQNSEVLIEDDEGSMIVHWKKSLTEMADELTVRVNKAWVEALLNIEIKYIYEG